MACREKESLAEGKELVINFLWKGSDSLDDKKQSWFLDHSKVPIKTL